MKKPLITIGTDPEIFAMKNGKVVSAHDLVPGTKAEPHKLSFGAVQADGTAIEFNTKPATTPKEFSYAITRVMNQIRKMVPEEYQFLIKPSVFFDPEYFKTLPELATELGCTPDYNAWSNGAMNPKPTPSGAYQFMRTGAGHIHIGFTKNADVESKSHLWDCATIVKSLDNVFEPFLSFFDNDRDRARLYGGPGAFRPKPYGVEYRRLSNAWLHDRRLWPWVFNVSKFVVEQLLEGKEFHRRHVDGIYQYISASFNGDRIEHTNSYMSRAFPGFPPFPLKTPLKAFDTPKKKRSKKLIVEPAAAIFA